MNYFSTVERYEALGKSVHQPSYLKGPAKGSVCCLN